MLIRFLRFGLVLALPALAIACATPSNDAPIIDSVDAPLVVTEQNGAYSIPVTLLFHDNDGEAITRLHYRLPPDIDAMIDVPAPNPTLESAQLTIVIKAADLDTSVDDSNLSAKRGDGKRGDNDKDNDRDRDHRRGRGSRALSLSIVDGRGAESLPLSSTVTLD